MSEIKKAVACFECEHFVTVTWMQPGKKPTESYIGIQKKLCRKLSFELQNLNANAVFQSGYADYTVWPVHCPFFTQR